jgi:maltose/moltooligosaccharide transporter
LGVDVRDPLIMVASMVPKERAGVYMGIANMMIVIPLLIESFTFGWIFENLLGASGSNAIMLSGALLILAAIAMTWIRPPAEEDESALMPLGKHRHIFGVRPSDRTDRRRRCLPSTGRTQGPPRPIHT